MLRRALLLVLVLPALPSLRIHGGHGTSDDPTSGVTCGAWLRRRHGGTQMLMIMMATRPREHGHEVDPAAQALLSSSLMPRRRGSGSPANTGTSTEPSTGRRHRQGARGAARAELTMGITCTAAASAGGRRPSRTSTRGRCSGLSFSCSGFTGDSCADAPRNVKVAHDSWRPQRQPHRRRPCGPCSCTWTSTAGAISALNTGRPATATGLGLAAAAPAPTYDPWLIDADGHRANAARPPKKALALRIQQRLKAATNEQGT